MTKYETPKDSFDAIQQAILPKSGIPLSTLADPLIQSVIYDAYKNCAVQETIYGVDGQPIAHESLCHPVDDSGREYPIEAIANHCYDKGLAIEFDTLTSSLGIKKAKQTGNIPITLNISVVSALSPDFFEGIHTRVLEHGLRPEDVIFEILEHDVDRNADITHLNEMKERGYRFALDDFGENNSHKNRLLVFGDLVDLIKVDGPFIRGYLDNGFETHTKDGNDVTYHPKDLNRTLDIIREHYDKSDKPVPTLVAERVRNEEEIKELMPLGFTGFQSRDLNSNAFSCNFDPYELDHEELVLAGGARICDYD